MNPVSYVMGWLEKNPVFTWGITLVYASIIFLLSSMPYPPQPVEGDTTVVSTTEHVIEYGILGFLLLAGFRCKNKGVKKRAFLLAAAIATLYGVTDEIHQFFVPNRFASITDVLADGAGALLGAFIGEKS